MQLREYSRHAVPHLAGGRGCEHGLSPLVLHIIMIIMIIMITTSITGIDIISIVKATFKLFNPLLDAAEKPSAALPQAAPDTKK